ncbi:uncharacterized protein OCT59_021106 [Rhizophagus irregularis]|uniref:Kelch-like protein 17 n=1 Tax=Rhizophagus irregularis (strain DAOM 197198w) TaxID=1432141 RepID=A0A015IDR1_RHIIW|nr:hypothetical protein RirG_256440 [Rhizophagus irregularis DAOM 197198w]UZO02627.1 hypothetical protein OCT59_021106 [Rhizophagus irregularis]
MANELLLSKLSQNLLEILDDEEYYDVTIEVGNDPYVKVFRAHMVILNYRSPYLRRILSTNKRKNDGTLTHIKLPSILPEIFQIILRYIYGGELTLEEYDTSYVVKILVAASELSLQELIPHLQSFLIKNKTKWIEQNFNSIYQTSFENDSFLDLQKFCTELISKQPDKIFNSPDFTSISEKVLISLIQLDKVQMSEVQIWEHVLKWGIAQNPELSSDPSNYSNDDFNVLKNTLQQFIPFINFTEFTSKEFLNKVYPYKKIIPEDLHENLISCFLDNDYKPSKKSGQRTINETKKISLKNIDSKIITIQHAELISKWIDRLDITDELKNSYDFKLIFRGSRDGFTPEKFHEICDDKSHTVSIIKVKNSDEILGGYNPIMWESRDYDFSDYDYSKTKDSFIFSFNNKVDIKNHILSRVENENYAIDNSISLGPSFGISDLVICGDFFHDYGNYCKRSSYEKQIRETGDKFAIEEYEIFQIIVT